MRLAEAVAKVREALGKGYGPNGQPAADQQGRGLVFALNALGLIAIDPEPDTPVEMIDCTCSCTDRCPQGNVGVKLRCRIPLAKATIDGRPVLVQGQPSTHPSSAVSMVHEVVAKLEITARPYAPAPVERWLIGRYGADQIIGAIYAAGFKIRVT